MKIQISDRFWEEIQKRASKRNISFILKKDEAWKVLLSQNKKCAITGIEIDTIRYGYRGNASLDRIQSDKSYNLYNIQWVLGDINLMKKDYNEHYFKYLCSLVTNPIKI